MLVMSINDLLMCVLFDGQNLPPYSRVITKPERTLIDDKMNTVIFGQDIIFIHRLIWELNHKKVADIVLEELKL